MTTIIEPKYPAIELDEEDVLYVQHSLKYAYPNGYWTTEDATEFLVRHKNVLEYAMQLAATKAIEKLVAAMTKEEYL